MLNCLKLSCSFVVFHSNAVSPSQGHSFFSTYTCKYYYYSILLRCDNTLQESYTPSLVLHIAVALSFPMSLTELWNYDVLTQKYVHTSSRQLLLRLKKNKQKNIMTKRSYACYCVPLKTCYF